MRITLDAWDFGAVVAVGAVAVGLFVAYWPAGLVAVGGGYLWTYYHRERTLAAKPHPRHGDAGQ